VRPGPDTPGFAIRTGDEEAVVTVYRNEQLGLAVPERIRFLLPKKLQAVLARPSRHDAVPTRTRHSSRGPLSV
jgi:hypothetical protein